MISLILGFGREVLGYREEEEEEGEKDGKKG